jgi:hypothetical protein
VSQFVRWRVEVHFDPAGWHFIKTDVEAHLGNSSSDRPSPSLQTSPIQEQTRASPACKEQDVSYFTKYHGAAPNLRKEKQSHTHHTKDTTRQ